MQKQLVAQKIHIEENEDRDTGLEQRHYKEDADCVTAKVPLGDLDLYDGTYISLESKDIRSEGCDGLLCVSQLFWSLFDRHYGTFFSWAGEIYL